MIQTGSDYDISFYIQGALIRSGTEIDMYNLTKRFISLAAAAVLTASALLGTDGLSATAQAFSGTSPFTTAIYTHNDRFSGMNVIHGIDVYHGDGTVDWSKAKAGGVDFAIIKIGSRSYGSAANLFSDSEYKTNITGAYAAGIQVGAYFWTEAVSVTEAIAEAQYTISLLQDYADMITMPVVLDWEYHSKWRRGGLSKSTNTAIITTWCDLIKQAGYVPMIYANKSDLGTYMDGAALGKKYDIWVAQYNTKTTYANDYSIWQYGASNTVPGVNHDCDINFWYTSGNVTKPTFPNGGSSSPNDIAKGGPSGNPSTPSTPAPSATEAPEPEELEDTSLSASSSKRSITLSWDKVSQAGGYQIYRKDTYNGKYKKIKTISDGATATYTDNSVSTNHEYYYKIRAFYEGEDGALYSDWASATDATQEEHQVGITTKTLKLTKKPGTSQKRITVARSMPVAIDGITHLNNGKKYLHVTYQTTKKSYTGYVPTSTRFHRYEMGTVTSQTLNLRKKANASAKLIMVLPKGARLPILGHKKAKNGATWYKTQFVSAAGKLRTGYVHSSYVEN